MVANSRSALVADIGGTTCRFAIADIDELSITHFAAFRSEMFGSIEEAVKGYMASIPYRPPMAGFAVAAPESGGRFQMTNLPWSFGIEDLRRATACSHIRIVNDFEALALALPSLVMHDLETIRPGRGVANATRIVLGPGTGLGVAALAQEGSRWIALPSEGGHVTFASEGDVETEISRAVCKGADHPSAERLISGAGLVATYRALRGEEQSAHHCASVAEIVKKGLSGEDKTARKALDLFVRWLGRFAGDMALAFAARGGVYIGGGIAPHIGGLLRQQSFIDAFQSKGRMQGFLAPIPLHIIKASDAGLRGAAIALSNASPVR